MVKRAGREEVEEEKEEWGWKGARSWPRRPVLRCRGSWRDAEAMLRGRGIPEPDWDAVRTCPPALILQRGQKNADRLQTNPVSVETQDDQVTVESVDETLSTETQDDPVSVETQDDLTTAQVL